MNKAVKKALKPTDKKAMPMKKMTKSKTKNPTLKNALKAKKK